MKLLLDDGELFDLGLKQPVKSIRCDSGLCWVTVENDSRDLILRSGQQQQFFGSGRMIITALAPTKLQLWYAEEAQPVLRPRVMKLQKKRALI
jgi:hypothetical protein